MSRFEFSYEYSLYTQNVWPIKISTFSHSNPFFIVTNELHQLIAVHAMIAASVYTSAPHLPHQIIAVHAFCFMSVVVLY